MHPLDSPDAVVQAVIAAAAARQPAEVFGFIDPADLPRWRRVTLSMLRHHERQPTARQVFAEWGAERTEDLEALPDAELFARWMQAFSLVARTRVAYGGGDAPPAPVVERVVLGTVREGDDLAHVLYREIVDAAGTALRIATLRRTSDGWKMNVDYDLLGTASLHWGPPPQPAAPPDPSAAHPDR